MIGQNDLVLDIECAHWTEYVVGGIASLDGGASYESFVTPDPEKLIDELLDKGRGRSIWAHFGGHYDFLWVLDRLEARDIPWSAAMAGTSPVAVTIGGGAEKIILRDSFRLWPQGLAAIGALLCRCHTCDRSRPAKCGCSCSCGMSKGTLPPALKGACTCGLACGGYCMIRQTPEHARMLAPYLEQDLAVLRKILAWVADLTTRHGIPLKTTVGATAWADAQAMLGLPNARDCIDLPLSLSLREGYYGGRVEVYRMRADQVWEQDVHSMYPWALSSAPVPMGAPTWHRDPLATGLDGIQWCDLTIPNSDLPSLPHREKLSLTYCHGPLSGAWTTHELRSAIARGAVIRRTHGGYVWGPARTADFTSWLHSRADLRTKYGYKSAESAWLKWMCNSITGKFAQRPDKFTITPWDPGCRCGRHVCTCRTPLDPTGRWWVSKRASVAASGHIGAAATLTARARVELLDELDHAGADRCYCDTDSVYSTRALTRGLGDQVGGWGQEGPLSDWIAVAPKVYAVGQKARCKGARTTDRASWRAYVEGEGIRRQGVRGLSGALRKGVVFEAEEGSRLWRGGPRPLVGSRERDGEVTRAITLERYRELRGEGDRAARTAALRLVGATG